MFVSCVCKRRWRLGGPKCHKMPESDICVCRKAKVVELHIVYMLKLSLKKKKEKKFYFENLVLRKFRKITAISHPCTLHEVRTLSDNKSNKDSERYHSRF